MSTWRSLFNYCWESGIFGVWITYDQALNFVAPHLHGLNWLLTFIAMFQAADGRSAEGTKDVRLIPENCHRTLLLIPLAKT